jgi:tetratricopeptide (TPR) repeat protein
MKRSILILLIIISLLIAASCGQSEKGKVMSHNSELIKLGDEYFNKGMRDSALTVYQQVAENAERADLKSDLTEAYSQIARCYLAMDKKEEGRPWLVKAFEIADPKDPVGWSRFLGVRGRYEWKDVAEAESATAPEASIAENTFKEMYDYCMKHKIHNRAIDAANMVSITAKIEDRVEWGLKGIEAAEDGGLENWLAPLWNNLGWTYDDLGQYDKSIEALMKAREYHYKNGKEMPMLIADWSVGHAYRMNGQLDSALTWINGVFEKASKIYEDNPQPENAEWVGFSHKELGEIAMIRADEITALDHFKQAYEHLTTAGMEGWDKKGYNELKLKIEKIQANNKKK